MKLFVINSIGIFLLFPWLETSFSQTNGPTISILELVHEIDAIRSRFDQCYFEYYAEPKYDALATEKGWRNSPVLEWRKIGRNGEKRYSWRKTESSPDAKIKYADELMISVWDGTTCRILEHKHLLIQDVKSWSCEGNSVFFALGWPENEKRVDPERVFIPKTFVDSEGKWELSMDIVNSKQCYLVSSTIRKMRFWFDKQTKMPIRYEFEKSPFCPNNKTIEFLDYIEIDSDGTQFFQKIITTADLFSGDGEFQGTAKIQIDVTNCSLNPAPELFVLDPEPGQLIIEAGKSTAESFIYYPNSTEFFEKSVAAAISQTTSRSFRNETFFAWLLMALAFMTTVVVSWISIQRFTNRSTTLAGRVNDNI